MKKEDYFHKRLKELITQYILLCYKISSDFPSDERFSLTSQCRRALLSIMLNYVEGYARSRPKQLLNFMKLLMAHYRNQSQPSTLLSSLNI